MCLLGLSLGSDGGSSLGNSLLIGQVVVLDGLEVNIELIDERNSGGNVQLNNLGLRDVVQVLDECAQRVTVGSNKNTLASLDGRGNLLVPQRQETLDSVEERLAQGDLLGGELSVASIMTGPVLAGSVQSGRGEVVGTTPDLDLKGAKFKAEIPGNQHRLAMIRDQMQWRVDCMEMRGGDGD